MFFIRTSPALGRGMWNSSMVSGLFGSQNTAPRMYDGNPPPAPTELASEWNETLFGTSWRASSRTVSLLAECWDNRLLKHQEDCKLKRWLLLFMALRTIADAIFLFESEQTSIQDENGWLRAKFEIYEY